MPPTLLAFVDGGDRRGREFPVLAEHQDARSRLGCELMRVPVDGVDDGVAGGVGKAAW